MKKILFICISLLVIVGCKKVITKVAPTVSTTTSTYTITATTATITGSITDDGGDPITAKGVVYGLSPNPTISDSKTSDGTGIGTYTSIVSGLSPGKTYYFRTYATNSTGTSYGDQLTLTTQAVLSTVTTTAASVITTGSITSGGNITADCGGAITARGVCWSTSTGPTIALTTKTSNGTGTGSFISNITGLATNTLYYIRAYATNSAGTSYGNEVTANTLSQDIKNIVPDNILTIISNLGMPMFTGKTPPQISNFYKLSPNALFNSNVPNDYAKGTTFFPVNFHFYNQNNTLLTIKLDYVEIGTGGGSGSGKEAFLSGSGNNFSAFLKVNYTASGQTSDMITIYSGTITSTGIKDLYYALFMVDDHGDPGNLWIANGTGRVFYDSDGMGSIIQSLTSQNFGINLGTMATPASISIKGQ